MSVAIARAWDQLRSDLASLRRDRVLPAYAVLFGLLLGFFGYSLIRASGYQSSWIDGWGVDMFELAAGAMCILAGISRRRGSVVLHASS